MTEATVVAPVAPFGPEPGHNRRLHGGVSPTGHERRGVGQAGSIPAPAPAPVAVAPKPVPMRAKFVLTEINQTSRGAAILTLAAAYDHTIDAKQRLAPGAIPVGQATIEVSPDYAAKLAHGAFFYLVSA